MASHSPTAGAATTRTRRPAARPVWVLVVLVVASFTGVSAMVTRVDAHVDISIVDAPVLAGYANHSSTGAAVARWDWWPGCIAADEFAAAQQPRGIQFWEYVASSAPDAYHYARIHGVFTSAAGDRRGRSNAGGDVVQVHPNGTLWYNWSIADAVYDQILATGLTPLVEVGYMPVLLSSNPDSKPERREPAEYDPWTALVTAFVEHLQARYGAATLRAWRFEVWNEPDAGSFWADGFAGYARLYNATARAIKAVDPALRVGGPGVAKDMNFFREFLEFCRAARPPLDFISFHTKGGGGGEANPSHATLLGRVREYFDILVQFPEFDQNHAPTLEYICTEADPIVGSHRNKYDYPNFEFRDHEYYSAWYAYTVTRLVELQLTYNFSLHGLFSHNILFPWEARTFHGTRGFVTPLFTSNAAIPTDIPGDMPLPPCSAVVGKPVHSVAQLVARIPRGSAHVLPVETTGFPNREKVVALACRVERAGRTGYLVMVTHHEETRGSQQTRAATVTLAPASPGGLGGASYNLTMWRVDRTHNNAFRRWQEFGSPERVTPTQAADLQATARLSNPSSRRVSTTSAGALALELELPPYSVQLLEIWPTGGPA